MINEADYALLMTIDDVRSGDFRISSRQASDQKGLSLRSEAVEGFYVSARNGLVITARIGAPDDGATRARLVEIRIKPRILIWALSYWMKNYGPD